MNRRTTRKKKTTKPPWRKEKKRCSFFFIVLLILLTVCLSFSFFIGSCSAAYPHPSLRGCPSELVSFEAQSREKKASQRSTLITNPNDLLLSRNLLISKLDVSTVRDTSLPSPNVVRLSLSGRLAMFMHGTMEGKFKLASNKISPSPTPRKWNEPRLAHGYLSSIRDAWPVAEWNIKI